MKHISEAMNLTTPSPDSTPRPDSGRSAKLWSQLGQLFGKAFFRENGDEPGALWEQAIARLTDKQIATGLANLANDDLSFPANLSQFVSACKRQTAVRHLGVTYEPLAIEDQDRERRKADAHIAKLLEMQRKYGEKFSGKK